MWRFFMSVSAAGVLDSVSFITGKVVRDGMILRERTRLGTTYSCGAPDLVRAAVGLACVHRAATASGSGTD